MEMTPNQSPEPKMQTVKLATVLINHNDFHLTIACIKSLREHETSDNFIIVVDNASDDKEGLKNLKNDFDNIEVQFLDENIGFGQANNHGVKWAQENLDFESILILNNDTIITKNCISRLLPKFDSSEKPGIITCRIMYENPSHLVWYGGGFMQKNNFWPVIIDINKEPSKVGALKSKYVDFVSGCFMLFSKESIAQIEGFDPFFFLYVEDLEMSMRAKEMKMLMWYDGDSVIYHKVHGSDDKHKGLHPKNPNITFHFYHKTLNQWYAFNKHLKGKHRRRFRLKFWMRFHFKLGKLIILSPSRFKVIRASFKVLSYILTGKK